MKKILLLLIVCACSSVRLFAQSIKTSFVVGTKLTNIAGIPIHTFYSGEIVTIHAYKKRSSRYHFLVETDNYAANINCTNIPFNVTEKELKKLPNALSNKADIMLKERQQAVYQRLTRKEQQAQLAKEKAEADAKHQYRKKALEGKIRGILSGNASLIEDENGLHRFVGGENVTIVGYTQIDNHHYYAMYSDEVAGTFHSSMPAYMMFINDRDIEF